MLRHEINHTTTVTVTEATFVVLDLLCFISDVLRVFVISGHWDAPSCVNGAREA